MKQITYSIPSIHCAHCVHTIQMELEDIQGVKKAKADLATKKVEVEFEGPADEELIIATLKEINYPPEI